MREQDRRAVEGMARCGIDLEGLVSAFAQFPKEEIESVYYEIHKDSHSCLRRKPYEPLL